MLTDTLRRGLPFCLGPAGVALIAAGCSPGSAGRTSAPGGGTAGDGQRARLDDVAIAAAVAIALISMLLGLPGSQGTLIGGPWVTLMLAFSVLNTVLLAAEIWVAYLVAR